MKFPLEELTKENNNEKFHELALCLSHVLGSKSIWKSGWTLLINPKKKNEWLWD